MLWRNASCVVIGRNQDAAREIDREYAIAENIDVVRRMEFDRLRRCLDLLVPDGVSS